MPSTADQLLSLARRQLQNAVPGWDREKAALRILEHGVQNKEDDCARDPRLWACIAYLRRKQGDSAGEKHAKALACQYRSSVPGKLTFNPHYDNETVSKQRINANVPQQRSDTKQTPDLAEMHEKELLVQHPLQRNKLLRQQTEHLFGKMGIDVSVTQVRSEYGRNSRAQRLVNRSKHLRLITTNLLNAAKETQTLV